MPRINLLPWREELRQQRNKEFGVAAVIVVLLMGGIVAGVHRSYEQQIKFQRDKRNAFLEAATADLDIKIKEIKDLEAEKERLLARMQIIQRLQSSRPEVVHLLDELVTTLPEGVYYTKIQQKGRGLSMQGVAQSNARVSSLMRQLDASEYLANPALVEIAAARKKIKGATEEALRLSNFRLNVKQEEQKKASTDESGESGESS
jgi:type IV pilus assembly protein PilN